MPFRDSKLTHLLRESLGGNSKTTLICTISRLQKHADESYQTLCFAERAKKIQNKAVTNIQKSPQEMERMIKILKEELRNLKFKLSAYEASGAVITVSMDSFIESGSHDGEE